MADPLCTEGLTPGVWTCRNVLSVPGQRLLNIKEGNAECAEWYGIVLLKKNAWKARERKGTKRFWSSK